jgi:iron complex transport system ATP-binding protein
MECHAHSRQQHRLGGQTMTTLAAHGVTVLRQTHVILDNISFSASGGDFVAVLGPSGTAKSALLAVLAGLLQPSAGSITLNDTPLTLLSEETLARHRGYLPRNPPFDRRLPVERLVALGPFDSPPESYRPHIEAVVDRCGLTPKRLQATNSLRRGELARALLARALVGNPGVLIADEPEARLDHRETLKVASLLRTLAENGKLVIAALHDPDFAARAATRVVTLRLGRIAVDEVQQRKRRPVGSAAVGR